MQRTRWNLRVQLIHCKIHIHIYNIYSPPRRSTFWKMTMLLAFLLRERGQEKKQESMKTMLRCGERINGREGEGGRGTELFYMEPFTLGGTLYTPSSTLQPRGLFSTKKSPCSDTRTVTLASCAKFSALLKATSSNRNNNLPFKNFITLTVDIVQLQNEKTEKNSFYFNIE